MYFQICFGVNNSNIANKVVLSSTLQKSHRRLNVFIEVAAVLHITKITQKAECFH